MSKDLSIWATVSATYEERNIKHILENGSKLGIQYYKFILGEMNVASKPLAIEQATKDVILGDPEGGLHCLTVQIKDTYATLHFLDEGNLSIMFSGLSILWAQKYLDGEEDIDVARYAKVLLELVEGFKILEFRVEEN